MSAISYLAQLNHSEIYSASAAMQKTCTTAISAKKIMRFIRRYVKYPRIMSDERLPANISNKLFEQPYAKI